MTRDERTADLLARDLRHVWHPFTQQQVWPVDDPLVIDRAEGMYLVASDGRRYLDAVSSLWVTLHGHAVPEIDDAVRRQLDKVAHSTFLGLTHEPAIELAEQLLATAPAGLNRVFYAGDGSSAVEAALKMAYQSAAQRGEDRPLYVHVQHGYHGDTLGAVSVGGIELFHATYRPILLETRQVSSPGERAAGESAGDRAAAVVAELDELMAREGHRVSAVIVEPIVQAAAGMLTHDPEFLRGVRAACDVAGALMIADEVATGIGRTGMMWACEHAGVAPDLLTCGKGLSAGYLPIAAVLATEAVYESFLGRYDEFRTFFHGHTYTANPLACAAALANLRLMRERDTLRHARWVAETLTTLLKPLADEPCVAEVRQAGTMTGIELAGPDGTAFPSARRTGFDVAQRARARGVLIRPLGDVVVLMPPLAIGEDDLRLLADATVESVRAAVADRG
ncbi:MAG TPA: adenosylmethionine--8-amino-7-oxononanoate transaminase [Mycobacteriales bacterium]|nr:adenosylmethionine--8-amino-7-oxononanoate transaminase [Mycobacteriales bacterium]